MKKILFSLLAVAFVLAAIAPAAVQAADSFANVKNVSVNGGSVTISGDLPCSTWSAYSVVNVAGNKVNISVYKVNKTPAGRMCPMVLNPYSLSVRPAIVAGVEYSVIVNGVYYANMQAGTAKTGILRELLRRFAGGLRLDKLMNALNRR